MFKKVLSKKSLLTEPEAKKNVKKNERFRHSFYKNDAQPC